jgi:PKD repeat protein
LSAVDKPLTCSVDFGDGSAPVEVQNCQRNAAVTHEYAEAGAYSATLTVRGGDRVLRKAIVIEVSDDEVRGDCGILSENSRFTASASFSYAASGASGGESIDHQASATLHATLAFAGQGGDGISFVGKPTGMVTYSERTDLHGELLLHERGSGAPLANGSQILLNVNRRECTFNIHVQASVAGTTQWGEDDVAPAEHFVATFNSEHIPFPSGLSASFSGAYPAHSVVDSPELMAFYYVDNYQLASWLGEDGLGTAQVAWQIALEE